MHFKAPVVIFSRQAAYYLKKAEIKKFWRDNMLTAIKYGVYAALIITGIILLVVLFKNGKPIRTLFWSGMAGVICLFAVYFIGKYTAQTVAINGYTLAGSFFGGVPGVIALVVIGSVLGI